MRPSKISILAAALSLAFVAACNRADETADANYGNEPATTASQPATDTATAPSTAAATSPTTEDTTGSAGTTGIEPAAPVPPATTTANATTSFDDMDVNNDGAISQDELSDTNPLRQDFSQSDKDGNGTLSRAEVEAHHRTMPGG